MTETLRSVESFYDSKLSNIDHDGMRRNCFNILTKGGHAFSYDELNEGLPISIQWEI